MYAHIYIYVFSHTIIDPKTLLVEAPTLSQHREWTLPARKVSVAIETSKPSSPKLPGWGFKA